MWIKSWKRTSWLTEKDSVQLRQRWAQFEGRSAVLVGCAAINGEPCEGFVGGKIAQQTIEKVMMNFEVFDYAYCDLALGIKGVKER